jgi:hypothetical protein
MKLYTEEELLKAMSYSRSYDANWVMTENEILKLITPIELPSDAEIEEASPYIPSNPKIDYLSYQKGFDKGAKWIKEQILNQNK